MRHTPVGFIDMWQSDASLYICTALFSFTQKYLVDKYKYADLCLRRNAPDPGGVKPGSAAEKRTEPWWG
ncbi:hypothetical protein KSZ_44190 [Dictyobacter formicarum]|uniref:Uncharacterized protein n=1 Tax=Dictyobacter formicarum TaxID=2778368 RepID=A0ABQ3VKS0_9CHLR|nr:hypothetical protein KSZ_44190 [Dictyobacter formicarum]